VTYHSQIGQDRFVDDVLGQKRGGTFLDVGCNHWQTINNTCFLEKQRDWSGVAIDVNPTFAVGWQRNRPKTNFYLQDATTSDYGELCGWMPDVIDYLSVDLEPPSLSWKALQRVLESRVLFRVITFETDFYRYKESREPSRKLLASLGYKLVVPGQQDDFWVNTKLC